MNQTKIVKDDSGIMRELPIDVPDSEAHKGIPLGINLSAIFPEYPEPFMNELQSVFEAHGLVRKEDFDKPGAYRTAQDCLKRVLKVEANKIVDKIRQEG